MTQLETKLAAKVKELEDLRAKMNEAESTKQKLFQQALEVQGAAKLLVELVNAEKEARPAA
jgi:hypothetical protein